jgi:hypothetical protein
MADLTSDLHAIHKRHIRDTEILRLYPEISGLAEGHKEAIADRATLLRMVEELLRTAEAAKGQAAYQSGLVEGFKDALQTVREACAQLVEREIAESCHIGCVSPNGTELFCESYACHDFRRVATAIRARTQEG